MKAATLILLATVGAAVALGPGTAGAGTEDDTVVTSHPRQGGGYVLEVTAAAGQANNFQAQDGSGTDNANFTVSDEVGITDDSSKCTQESPTEVQCTLQGLRRVNVDTGDMGDGLSFLQRQNEPSMAFAASTGSGADRLEISGSGTGGGGGGLDRLIGGKGNQRLLGGDGPDKITGGRGNNDYCDGQEGDDSGGDGCETIVSL